VPRQGNSAAAAAAAQEALAALQHRHFPATAGRVLIVTSPAQLSRMRVAAVAQITTHRLVAPQPAAAVLAIMPSTHLCLEWPQLQTLAAVVVPPGTAAAAS